jgi:hypothetical protein
MSLLATLIGAFVIVTFVYVAVHTIRLSRKFTKTGKTDVLSVATSLSAVLYELFVLIPFQVVAQGYHFASHVASNWKYYAVLGVATLVIVGWSEYNHTAIVSINTVDKTVYRPILRDVIWNVTNVFRIVFDLVICWWNATHWIYMSTITETAKIVVHCEAANYRNQAIKAQALIESPFVSIVNFMAAKGTKDFDVDSVVFATSDFLHSFQPLGDCICEDLSFASDIVLDSLNSRNLSLAIDRTFNALVVIPPRLVFGTVVQLFQTHTLNPPSCKGINCKLQRAPKFDALTQAGCDAFYYTFAWGDQVLQIIYDQFFGNTHVKVPPLGKLFSSTPCVLVQSAGLVADIGFHIDLVFDGTNYLKYANVSAPITPLLNVSQGLIDFFDVFETDITDDLGCSLGYGSKVLTRLLNFTVLSTRQLFTNPAGLASFVKGYSHSVLNQDWDTFASCTVHPIKDVNLPAGQTVEYILKVLERIAVAGVELIGNFGDLKTYMANHFPQDSADIFNYAGSFAISYGNFWRQFSDTCPLLDPSDPVLARTKMLQYIIGDRSFFCALGSFVQTLIQLVFDLAQMIVEIAVDVVFNNKHLDTIIEETYDFVSGKITQDYEGVVQFSSYMAASPFIKKCKSSNAKYKDSIGNFISAGVNITSIPLRMLTVGLEALKIIKQNPSINSVLLEHIICDITLALYDFTIGQMTNLGRYLSAIGDCVFGNQNSSFGKFGETLWKTFGWDDHSSGNMRTIICKLSSALVKFIAGLINIITKIQGFIFEIIQFFKCAFSELKRLKTAFTSEQVCVRWDWDIDFSAFRFNIWVYVGTDQCYGYYWKIPRIFTSLAHVVTTIGSIIQNIFFPPPTGKCTQVSISPNKRDLQQQYDRLEPTVDYDASWTYTFDMVKTLQDKGNDSLCNALFLSYMEGRQDTDWEKSLVENRLWQCAGSQLFAHFINHKLAIVAGIIDDNTEHKHTNASTSYDIADLIDGDAFYDTRATVNTTVTLLRAFGPIASFFLSSDYSSMKWRDYYQLRNNDAEFVSYTRAFGNRWESTLDYIKFELSDLDKLFGNGDTAFSTFDTLIQHYEDSKFVMSSVKKFGYDVWVEEGGLLDSLAFKNQARPRESPSTKRNRRNPFVEATPVIAETDDTDQFEFDYDHPIFLVVNKTKDKFEGLRVNITNWWTRFTSAGSERAIKNRASLLRAWNYTTTIVERKRTQSIRGYSLTSSSDISTSICVPGTNECLNCALAKRILDNIVTVLCDCINQPTIDINSTHIHPTQKRNAAFSGSKKDAEISAYTHPTGMAGTLVGIYEWLLGGAVDMNQTSSTLASFLIRGTATTDPNAFDWLGFIAPCQYETLDCANNAKPGFGLGRGILYALAFLIMFSIFAALIFPPASQASTLMWLSIFPIILFFAYNWSFRCYLAIPRCVADDAYSLITSLNPKCTEWNVFLPGLVKEYGEDNCATSFYDCAAAPYGLHRSERTFFLLMETVYPQFNAFLRNTNVGAFSWVRQFYAADMTFDFGNSTAVPDVYRSCLYVSGVNLVIVSFFILVAVVLACLLLPIALLIYVAVLRMIAVGIAFTFMGMNYYFVEDYYESKQDIKQRAHVISKEDRQNLIIPNKNSQPALNRPHIKKLISDYVKKIRKGKDRESTLQGNAPKKVNYAAERRVRILREFAALSNNYFHPTSTKQNNTYKTDGNKLKQM